MQWRNRHLDGARSNNLCVEYGCDGCKHSSDTCKLNAIHGHRYRYWRMYRCGVREFHFGRYTYMDRSC